MKFVLVALVALLAIQSAVADNVALRLKNKVAANPMSADSLGSSVTESIPATQLQGSLSASTSSVPTPASASAALSQSMASMTSTTPVASASASASASTSAPCNAQPACTSVSNSESETATSPDDALKPIADWIKEFKTRAGADSNDLLSAAKITVRPLIDKLKRNQEASLEKLAASNKAILDHVEEATTEHVYNLLRAEKIKEEKQEAADSKKEKLAELKAEVDQKKLQTKILAGESSHESSHESSSF